MSKKLVLVVLVGAALLTATAALAQWPAPCLICWKDGGYFDDDPWYCRDADDYGYRNCSATQHSCGNWEPLCEVDWYDNPNCFYTGWGWVCY